MSDGRPVRRKWVMVAAGTGTALGFLDQTIIGVALPTIGADVGLSPTQRDLVVEAYLIPLAALALVAGSLGARIGARRLFTGGVILFVAGSVGAGLSTGPEMLIASRAVQGIGAAAMFTAGQAIVASAFPKSHRGRAIGGFVAVTTLALSTGPLIGGALVDGVGWRAVFFVNPFLALATLPYILGFARNPEGDGPEADPPPFDAPGFLTVVPMLLLGVYGITAAGRDGWSAPAVAAIVVSVALIPVLLRLESRREQPVLDVRFLRDPVIAASLAVVAAVGFVQLWGVIAFPSFLQADLGFSPFEAGAGLLPLTIALTAGQIVAGQLVDRYGPRAPGFAGTAGAALSLLAMAFVLPELSYALLIPIFVVTGLSLALAQTPMNTAAMNAVGAEQRTRISGLLATTRQASALFGLAILSSLGALLSRDDIHAPGNAQSIDAIQVGLYAAAVVLVVAAAVVAWKLMRSGPAEPATAPEGLAP